MTISPGLRLLVNFRNDTVEIGENVSRNTDGNKRLPHQMKVFVGWVILFLGSFEAEQNGEACHYMLYWCQIKTATVIHVNGNKASGNGSMMVQISPCFRSSCMHTEKFIISCRLIGPGWEILKFPSVHLSMRLSVTSSPFTQSSHSPAFNKR